MIPYRFYERFGDLSLFDAYRTNMLRWFDCMKGLAEDGLIVREREGGWCLGDWCVPFQKDPPPPLVNTYYYLKCMEHYDEMAGLRGEPPRFRREIGQSLQAVTDRYGSLRDGPSLPFLAGLGVGGAETLRLAANRALEQGCFETGIFGTEVLLRTLTEAGRADVVYQLLTSRKYPSYGYMMERGATTIWEDWNGTNSHNHPMFGSAAYYLFRALLGIRVDHAGKRIFVRPFVRGGDLSGSLNLFGGRLQVEVKAGRVRADYDGKVYRLTVLTEDGAHGNR